MDKEDFYHWEKMSLSGIISLMVKWFGFPDIVRRRLIEFLDELNTRENYLKETPKDQL